MKMYGENMIENNFKKYISIAICLLISNGKLKKRFIIKTLTFAFIQNN